MRVKLVLLLDGGGHAHLLDPRVEGLDHLVVDVVRGLPIFDDGGE